MRVLKKFETVDLNIFANASNLAYSAASIVVVEYSLAGIKVLLTSNVKDLCARNYYSTIIITLNKWSGGG